MTDLKKESIIVDRDIRISTVGRDDYPELEGKIVDYKEDLFITKGIVVGCNRSVGITVVAVDNKDDYLICLAGPVTPGGGTNFKGKNCTYTELFDSVLKSIQKGILDAEKLILMYTDIVSYGTPNGNSCAYRM